MKAKVDAVLLKSAGRSIVALSNFPGSDKKDKSPINCLITAKGEKVTVEASGLGIYVKHVIPAEVANEGVASISAATLTKLRSADFLEMQTKGKNALALKHKSTRSEIEMPDGVTDQVKGGKPKKGSSTICAVVPVELLKESMKAISFKPGLKEETLRLQVACGKKNFEMDGMDSYSFARVSVTDKKLFTCKKPFQLVLRSSVLSNILKEIEHDEGKVKIGVRKNKAGKPTSISIVSEFFEVHYPTLDTPFIDLGSKLTEFLKSNKVDASFVSDKASLVEVVSDCCALHSSEESGGSLKLRLDVTKKKITISTDSTGASTKTHLHPSKVKVKGTRSMWVHEGYFNSFLNLAPEGVPLMVESCGDRYLRLRTGEDLNSGSIEYLVSRVANPSKQG
jgi:hypothetical protein